MNSTKKYYRAVDELITFLLNKLATPVYEDILKELTNISQEFSKLTGREYRKILISGKTILPLFLPSTHQAALLIGIPEDQYPELSKQFTHQKQRYIKYETDMEYLKRILLAIHSLMPSKDYYSGTEIIKYIPDCLYNTFYAYPEVKRDQNAFEMVCAANPKVAEMYSRIEDTLHYYLATRFIL